VLRIRAGAPAGSLRQAPLTFSTVATGPPFASTVDEGLIAAVVAATPTVVVLVAAALCYPWPNDVPAVLQGFYGGMEAARPSRRAGRRRSPAAGCPSVCDDERTFRL